MVSYLPPSAWAPWLLRGPASAGGNAHPCPWGGEREQSKHKHGRESDTVTDTWIPPRPLGAQGSRLLSCLFATHRWQETESWQLQVELKQCQGEKEARKTERRKSGGRPRLRLSSSRCRHVCELHRKPAKSAWVSYHDVDVRRRRL